MTFLLFAEGETEKKALGDFLQRWLNSSGRLKERVRVRLRNLKGWSNLQSKGHRGIRAELDKPGSDDVIAAIGLLDLYGPTFYPANARTIEERYGAGVSKIEREVDRDRFRMFFAVHETEAWLLSQPDLFPTGIRERLKKHEKRPETVNFSKPPSKRIAEAYGFKQWTYRKTIDGPGLFSRADPEVAYQACPYLKQMLDAMLTLARQAGL